MSLPHAESSENHGWPQLTLPESLQRRRILGRAIRAEVLTGEIVGVNEWDETQTYSYGPRTGRVYGSRVELDAATTHTRTTQHTMLLVDLGEGRQVRVPLEGIRGSLFPGQVVTVVRRLHRKAQPAFLLFVHDTGEYYRSSAIACRALPSWGTMVRIPFLGLAGGILLILILMLLPRPMADEVLPSNDNARGEALVAIGGLFVGGASAISAFLFAARICYGFKVRGWMRRIQRALLDWHDVVRQALRRARS